MGGEVLEKWLEVAVEFTHDGRRVRLSRILEHT